MREQDKVAVLNLFKGQILQANSIEQLAQIKATLKDRAAELGFKMGLLGWSLVVGLLLQVNLVVIMINQDDPVPGVLIGLIAATVMGCWLFFSGKRSARPNPANLLVDLDFKACCLKNGIERLYDTADVEAFLLNEFSEFNRGNYSRGFTEIYRGTYLSEGKSAPFYVYYFNWTDQHERTESHIDDDGISQDETEVYYKTYYRNGIVFPVHAPEIRIWKRGVLESSKGFSVASSLFNSSFNVAGQHELDLGRFLKPAVVEQILNFMGRFSQIGYESNGKGSLLVATTDNPLVRVKTHATGTCAFDEEMPLLLDCVAHVKDLEFQLDFYMP